SIEMPPGKQLPAEIIADFVKWVELGAPDPRDHPPSAREAADFSWKMIFAERRSWWSLQPLRPAAPPAVEGDGRSSQPIGRFVRAKLREARLDLAPPADAAVLLRRLSFVLTGLPPDPGRQAGFSRDFAVDPDRVTAAMVDELLASPHFGEHF